jgi:hypothetical protein
VLTRLGVKRDKDDTKYVKNVRERLTQLKSPDVLQARVEDLPEPVQEPMKKKLDDVLKYALDNTPNPVGNQRISMAEAAKTDKMLLAVVNPLSALQRAVVSNDTDMVLHISRMWPEMFVKFQTILGNQLVDEDLKNLPYQKRMLIQRVTGINASGTSKGAVALAQGVFAKERESQEVSPVSAPQPTVGTAIQAMP